MYTPDMCDPSPEAIAHLLQIKDQIARLQEPLEVASCICVHLHVNILVLHQPVNISA